MKTNTDKLLELTLEIENFKHCAPDDDPVLQDFTIYGYKYLIKRFLKYARKVQSAQLQESLREIDVSSLESIYDVYELDIDVRLLIEELREILDNENVEWANQGGSFIEKSVIDSLGRINSSAFDLSKVIRFCEEINGSFGAGYFLSTSLLIRALLNHIPPVFGHKTFSQVVSQSSKSRKEMFRPLEEIARDIADLHTHDLIRHKESLPTRK